MKEIITIGIIFFAIAIIGDYFLRKKMKISKSENLMSNRTKRFQTVGVVLIVVCYLVLSFTIMMKNDNFNILFIFYPFFIAIALFRAFMEWRFNRLAKRWVIEIYSIVLLTLFMIVLLISGIMR